MRNLKKFLALVLATLMVISAAATVSAYSDVADDNIYAAAIAALTEYGIVNGTNTELDTFSPDDDVVRYQMALMMARALEPDTEDWQNGMAIFEDVTEWYGAIAYAYMNGIVTGMDATHFEPKTGIKCRDALIMAVRALGYEVDVTLTPYWIGAYQTAAKIGLTNNLKVNDPAKTLTRAETAQVIYNMLKATPADGGATIEEKNFDIKGDKNTTVAVITATSKQAFDGDVVLADDSTYVTLQLLNADGTLGGGFYAKFADLGFEEDVKPDDVIGYSVNLVNFEAGKFSKAVPNDAKIVLTTDDNVTVSSDKKKVTIDKVVYWLVDEYSADSIKNEIIVKTDDGRVATSLLDNTNKFYYNKDGNIVSPKDTKKELAIKTDMTAANGQTLYRLASADEDQYLVYTVSELLNVKEIYDEYNDVTSVNGYADLDKITDAVQLTLFDDNGDETYDRAISTPIYMSVFNNKDGKKVNIDSEAPGLSKSTEDVNFIMAKPLTKGDIFYYTYNKQTNTINVLGTVDVDYGTITGINLTADNAKDFTIKIGDTSYKFAGANDSTVVGAKIAKSNTGAIATDGIDAIVSKPALDTITYNAFSMSASLGATVEFYAYNGYIIYAEAYNVEDSYNLVAIKNMIDVDGEGLIADVYVDGKLVEDAVISEVINTATGKTVKLANLSSYAFSRIAYEYFDTNSNIYKGIELEDGTYRLGVALYDKEYDGISNEGFGYVKAPAGDIDFYDGISDNTTPSKKIRTNSDTVFYFINRTVDNSRNVISTLTVVQTSGKNYSIKTDYNTEIYVDKLGYSGKNAGIATKVIVYNASSVEGFGIAATVNSVVFVPGKISTGKYSIDTAKNFGLEGYEGAYYYYKNIAVDMSDGSTVSLYSDKPLTAGTFYQVDTNNVVVKDTDLYSKDIYSTNVVLDDTYKAIRGIFTAEDGVTTIKAIAYDKNEAKTVSNADAVALLGKKVATVYYLTDDEDAASDLKDGIFVMVVEAETDDTQVIKVTVKGVDNTEDGIVTLISKIKDTDEEIVDSKEVYKDGEYEFVVNKDAKYVAALVGDVEITPSWPGAPEDFSYAIVTIPAVEK